MSAGGRFLAVQRGVYDTGKPQRGLDVDARLRQAHRMATVRPVRVTLRDQVEVAAAFLGVPRSSRLT